MRHLLFAGIIGLFSAGVAQATSIGAWDCSDDGMPICAHVENGARIQIVPTIDGTAIDMGVILPGLCKQSVSADFSSGLKVKSASANQMENATCYYEFHVEKNSMAVMSHAVGTSRSLAIDTAAGPAITAPIIENDRLVYILQHWKREQAEPQQN